MFRLLIIILLLPIGSYAKEYDPIDKINREVNAVQFVSDIENYGVDDYTATPEEFYSRGGDCEDYAVAKYHRLIEQGFNAKKIKFVMVKTPQYTDHVVLMVRTGLFEKQVLDNLRNPVEDINYLTTWYRDWIFLSYDQFINR